MTALTFDHQSQTSGRHYRLTPVLNSRNATDWLIEFECDKSLIPDKKVVNQYKFNVFRLPVDKALFVDSDMLCLNNIEELADRDEFVAGINIGKMHMQMVNGLPMFNTGLFLCEPNETRFEDLQAFGRSWDREINFGDQPILNEYYLKHNRDEVEYLDLEWNVAITCYRYRRHMWNEMESRGIKFVHYTHFNPWTRVVPRRLSELHYLRSRLPDRHYHYRKPVSWWEPYYKRAVK